MSTIFSPTYSVEIVFAFLSPKKLEKKRKDTAKKTQRNRKETAKKQQRNHKGKAKK